MTTHFLATIKNGISYESNEPTLNKYIYIYIYILKKINILGVIYFLFFKIYQQFLLIKFTMISIIHMIWYITSLTTVSCGFFFWLNNMCFFSLNYLTKRPFESFLIKQPCLELDFVKINFSAQLNFSKLEFQAAITKCGISPTWNSTFENSNGT